MDPRCRRTRRANGNNALLSLELDQSHAWISAGGLHFRKCSSSLPDPFVDANVFLGRSVPGKILAHPVAHQLLPRPLIAEGPQRFLNRPQQSLAVVVGELEAGSLAGARVPMFNGIVEAAGGADDGDCAVLQAVDLVEAARLVSGGH